jgi:hypothetical protein
MTSPLADSDALHARARAFVSAFEAGRPMPEPFDGLACDLVRFQAAHATGYARLCRARGVDPSTIRTAGAAPAVPTEAFRVSRVSAFPEAETPVTFRTSGTTLGARGSHAMRTTASYDAAALAFGRWALASDLTGRVPVVALAPSAAEAPDSSLSHMLALFAEALGDAPLGERSFFLEGEVLDVAGLDERVARASVRGQPVLVLATSFALVHLLEALDDATFRLPEGSRVMQTGGFKGRSRELEPAVLRRELARAFRIPEGAIVGEYGMTELSSQFYESTLRSPGGGPGVYAEPPWARVIPVDTERLEPVPDGEVGIARIEDLMNVDSAFAVLASDRVRRVPGGFELLGRAPGSAPRGCSIAVDDILGRTRPS